MNRSGRVRPHTNSFEPLAKVWWIDLGGGGGVSLKYEVILFVFAGLDGSTSGQDREKLINQFNDPENFKIKVFMLSTR